MTSVSPYVPRFVISLSPLFILGTVILVTLIAFFAWSADKNVITETGLIEQGQNIFLAVACLFSAYYARQYATQSLDRYLRFGLMIFCFALLLREVDIDKFGSAAGWKTLENLVRGTAVIILLIYGGFVVKNFQLFWRNTYEIVRAPIVALTLIACATYLASWPFDKMLFKLSPDIAVFIEETLELHASLLFFFASQMPGHGAQQK